MRNVDIIQVERLGIDGEAMILGSDFDLFSPDVQYRMIASMVTEFQFECLCTKGQTEYLMTKTNAEHWFFSEELPHILNRIIHCFRVTGAVRKKNPIRI